MAGVAVIASLLPAGVVSERSAHSATADRAVAQSLPRHSNFVDNTPTLSGSCPKPGSTRTVKGVRFECTTARRWQGLATLSNWEWSSIDTGSSGCIQSGAPFTLRGKGFSSALGLPAVYFTTREIVGGRLPATSQLIRASVNVLSDSEALVTAPASNKFRVVSSAKTSIIVSGGVIGSGAQWGSGPVNWCGAGGGSGATARESMGGGKKTPTTTTGAKKISVSVPPIAATLISNVGNSKSAKFLGIRADLNGAKSQIPSLEVGEVSLAVCSVSGEIVQFLAEGNCDLRVSVGTNAKGLRIIVKKLLPRTNVDRPGGNLLDIKPLYITFKNGVDDRHDTEGLVATMVTSMADFFAEQHPGFELRVDTYDGLPDIQHVELPVTREEFLANWNSSYGPLHLYLRQLGFDLNLNAAGDNVASYETTRRIYVGVVESVTGGRQGAGFASGHTTSFCGGQVLVGGGAMVYIRDIENKPCTNLYETLRYKGSKDENYDFSNFRRFYDGDGLRSLPGCQSTFMTAFSRLPDQRDEALVKKNDPVYYPQYGGKAPPWVMDQDRRFYLRISNGPRAGNPCWDLAYSPFLMRMGSQVDQNDAMAGRVFVDRPDDTTAPQVKAYYVLAADSVDDRFDIGGQIAKQITTGNEWLYANGGKRIRWDTYKGEIDVTFVRLRQTEAELWMDPREPAKKCRYQSCPTLETLVLALQAQGHAPVSKINAVFYGGQRTFASKIDVPWCAFGGWGKAGHVAGYLVSDINVMTGQVGCSDMSNYATPTNSGNTVGIVMIHEIFHALGAVAFSGPPNGDGNGHIKNDPSDLMGGSQGIVKLDPGNDDYWRHGQSWVDAYRSAFMEPAEPGAVMPENWGVTYPDSWWELRRDR